MPLCIAVNASPSDLEAIADRLEYIVKQVSDELRHSGLTKKAEKHICELYSELGKLNSIRLKPLHLPLLADTDPAERQRLLEDEVARLQSEIIGLKKDLHDMKKDLHDMKYNLQDQLMALDQRALFWQLLQLTSDKFFKVFKSTKEWPKDEKGVLMYRMVIVTFILKDYFSNSQC